MDAFAVSVTSGLTVKGFGAKHACLLGLYFGGFQFLMPLLGYLLGSTVSSLVSEWAPYISFFLLAGAFRIQQAVPIWQHFLRHILQGI